MNKLKELYTQAIRLDLGVDYQPPSWVLTRISTGKVLTLAELTKEQHAILLDIQAEEFWPTTEE